MKKMIKNLMLVAVAAMGFVACQDGVDEVVVKPQDTVSVEFTASFDETRSQFGEKDDKSGYPSSWSGGEQIMLSLNETTPVIAKVESEGATANFTATLTSDGNTEGSIFAFSPAGTYENGVSTPGFTGISADYDSAYVYIPSEQSPIGNSCDENVHLLAAECAYTGGIPASANLSFAPVAAFGKMTITDFEGNIANVTLESSEPLAGNAYYYYAGEKVGTLVQRASGYVNTLVLDATNVENNVFWFGCIPAVLDGTTLTVVVTDTEEKTYTKEIDLTGKKLAFMQGRVANFAVSFAGIEEDKPIEVVDPSTFAYQLVTDASQLSVGKYVIIAASEYDVAMSTDQKSNNRGQATITKYDNIAEVSETVQYILLEEGAVANTYAFNVGNGYLYAASSGSNYLRTETTLSANSSWEIEILGGPDYSASIVAQGSNSRNVMQYNQSSSLFSCYSSASQKALALYVGVDPSTVVKKTPLATPTVTATPDVNKVTVSWEAVANAANYTVTFDGKETTTADCEVVFEDLEYDTTYTVSVVANPADDSELYYSSVAGTDSVTTGADPRTALATPKLVAGEITESSITVSWEAVDYASGYVVTKNGEKTNLEADVTTYTFENLSPATTYTITIYAMGDDISYINSAVDSIELTTTGTATVSTYTKITSADELSDGKYIIVYEDSSNAYVFSGVDAVNGYFSASITDNDTISGTFADGEVTIAAMDGGYSLKVANGYMSGTSGSNTLKFGTTASANTFEFNADGTVKITSNTSVFTFNHASNQLRFRYYKSTSYESMRAVTLYKKN